jgi:hypothetical protein
MPLGWYSSSRFRFWYSLISILLFFAFLGLCFLVYERTPYWWIVLPGIWLALPVLFGITRMLALRNRAWHIPHFLVDFVALPTDWAIKVFFVGWAIVSVASWVIS